MDPTNPVILQLADHWHIVEHSRRSQSTLCGQTITHRGPHARLSMIAAKNLCPTCLKLFREVNPKKV